MRKQTKLVAVLSTTALLAIGASAAAFAAGWDNSTGEWQWLDRDGIAVSNEWKKSGNDWFYLGDDGVMVTDSVIDDDGDYYYVNEAGAMVSNTWVSVDNEDGTGDAEYNWYYFGNDGKAYTNDSDRLTTSKIKTINGKKYTFDSEGKMLYGWISADNIAVQDDDDSAWKTSAYYFGDWTDGAAANGWVQLTVEDDDDTETYWFNFDSNGKKRTGEKTIDGKKYILDATDGHMLEDWADASSNTADGTLASDSVVYLNGDGSKRTKTWIWAVPDEDYIQDDYEDDEYSWFYTKSNGKLETDVIKKINGKSYAFDTFGRMQTSIVTTAADTKTNIETADSGTDYTDLSGDEFAQLPLGGRDIYYFSGSESDGSMKKGYQNVEFDDDTYQMYFNTSNGKAEDGYVSKIKKFCANGVVLKADTDENTYAAVKASWDSSNGYQLNYDGMKYGNSFDYENDDYVLVNTSGTIQTGVVNKKDADDRYYLTDKKGKILSVTENKLKKVTSTTAGAVGYKIDPTKETLTYYVEDVD